MVELEIPPRSAYVGVVRLALASLARHAGLPEEAIDDLKIAVSEACANAVIANEQAGSDAPVEVRWQTAHGRLVIEVGDRGEIYAGAPDGVDSEGFSSRLVMSLGLLRSLVDEFDFEPRSDGGMRARLAVHLPR